jgi:hypothetical protein
VGTAESLVRRRREKAMVLSGVEFMLSLVEEDHFSAKMVFNDSGAIFLVMIKVMEGAYLKIGYSIILTVDRCLSIIAWRRLFVTLIKGQNYALYR